MATDKQERIRSELRESATRVLFLLNGGQWGPDEKDKVRCLLNKALASIHRNGEEGR